MKQFPCIRNQAFDAYIADNSALGIHPAWDYELYLEDAQLETPYRWDLCVAVKEYTGRAGVLKEVRRYLKS